MKAVFTKSALFVGAVLAGGAVSLAAEPATEQSNVQEQLQALRDKVTQLEQQQKQVNESALQAVQKDATSRSQLMQAGGLPPFTGGFDKNKFTLQSEDGRFSFSPSFQVQVRNVTNFIDEDPADVTGDSSLENGFEIRRAKFGFSGKIAGDFSYRFVWATNRQLTATGGAGNVYLEDVQVSYKINDNWSLTAGQFKDPVFHEELVSSTKQLAADRSLLNEQLGGGITDRIQGAGVEFTEGPVWATVILHDGANSDNRDFRDSTTNTTDWGVTGRVEFTAFGDKKAYGDFSAMGNKDNLLVIGVAADVSGFASDNRFFYSVDAQWENTTGLGLYGAVIGRTIDPHGDGDETSDLGGLIQVAQMVSDKWEIFGRYGVIDFDNSDDVINEITFGANRFFYGHNAKLTLDVVVLPDGSPADTGLGYLNSGSELQVVGRVQFQLAI